MPVQQIPSSSSVTSSLRRRRLKQVEKERREEASLQEQIISNIVKDRDSAPSPRQERLQWLDDESQEEELDLLLEKIKERRVSREGWNRSFQPSKLAEAQSPMEVVPKGAEFAKAMVKSREGQNESLQRDEAQSPPGVVPKDAEFLREMVNYQTVNNEKLDAYADHIKDLKMLVSQMRLENQHSDGKFPAKDIEFIRNLFQQQAVHEEKIDVYSESVMELQAIVQQLRAENKTLKSEMSELQTEKKAARRQIHKWELLYFNSVDTGTTKIQRLQKELDELPQSLGTGYYQKSKDRIAIIESQLKQAVSAQAKKEKLLLKHRKEAFQREKELKKRLQEAEKERELLTTAFDENSLVQPPTERKVTSGKTAASQSSGKNNKEELQRSQTKSKQEKSNPPKARREFDDISLLAHIESMEKTLRVNEFARHPDTCSTLPQDTLTIRGGFIGALELLCDMPYQVWSAGVSKEEFIRAFMCTG